MRVISGNFKGREIKSVAGKNTRPTADKIKESIFNIIGPYFDGGIVLDLFAGTGNLGIESLSRGTNYCYFIDRDFNSINTIKTNINNLKLNDRCEIYKNDYLRAIKILNKKDVKFDIVFLDPPYKMKIIEEIVEFLDNNNMISNNGIIIAEYKKENSLPKSIGNMKVVKDVDYGITRISVLEKGE